MNFELLATDGAARRGRVTLAHGVVETPVFMPVGTYGTVKAMTPRDLSEIGAQICLGNTFHLWLRPGIEVIAAHGGLHQFMGWNGPLLTDSGGFQVFSLASLNKVDEDGVTFRSHIDGSSRHFSPEGVMRIETNLGADVIMQFDHVIPGQSEHAAARDASERSIRWLARCRAEFDRLHALPDAPRQTLFPIVQGGIHQDLRRAAARAIADMGDWDGFAIGGLSVGEAKPDMYAMLETCDDAIPADQPRYLMGVGYPEDLLEGVARGVDLFDCVAPTRMGRNAAALTPDGRVNMRRAEFREDDRPVVEGCACGCCRRFSRAYIRHLIQADEMLGARLLSLHNVHFLIALMREARSRIIAGDFTSWSREWLARYHSQPTSP